MPKSHRYAITTEWTGNVGTGTSDYTAYVRDHMISAEGKPAILGSSDPAFRGDGKRWNPEDLLVASVSACHKLWYLHLCAVADVVVTAYIDHAEGVMVEDAKRGGYFTGIVLRPAVTIARGSDPAKAAALHADAHHNCFIANSVNFPITCEPAVVVVTAG